MLRNLRKRIGYRGAALILFGLMYIMIGIGTYFNPTLNPHLWYTWWPLWFRVTEWVATGLFAAVAGFVGRLRTAGFVALYIGPVLRMTSFLIAVFFYGEAVRYFLGFAVWLLLTLVVVLISAWPEPVYVRDENE